MRLKKGFSIIELMTVILVILLLISLTIPVFVQLKMNARAALCKNNLRQIGGLINSYQTDYEGYFPNDAIDDIHVLKTQTPNNSLYEYWNGHLLPYIDVNLPDKYTRIATVTKSGCTRFAVSGQLGGPPNPPPADILKNGWVVVDDAFHIGGYNDLKVFICPEIHQNTFDVSASILYNGIKIPRISQITTAGTFPDRAGYDYGMGGGIPTTYLANEVFFGCGNKTADNSLRIDKISSISKKALILEGGFCGETPDYSLYYGFGMTYGDLSTTYLFNNSTEKVQLSYAHDNYDSFWIMNSTRFPSAWWSEEQRIELASKFNTQFAGKASMVFKSYKFGYSIISYVYPDNGEIFKEFFTANPPGIALGPFNAFIDEPNEFKFLTGNMNVLFGDNSVMTKDQAWLCNNRLSIGELSEE